MYHNLWRKWPETKGETKWPSKSTLLLILKLQRADCSILMLMDDVGGDIDVDIIDIGAAFSEARLFVCVV